MTHMLNERPKVKILTKVRRPFLTKTPDENEQQAVVDSAARYLSNTDGYPIKASIGLLEVGRKICIGPQYLNFYFNIESTKVDHHHQVKAVTLNLCPNDNKPLVPWEYTVQRLESFGDLDMAVWAHRIKSHFSSYTKAMANIYDQINSPNPEVQRQLAKIRMRAALTHREIESNCSYYRHVQFLKRDVDQPISCCYSEGFLKEIGHTTESFILWLKKNGIPKVMETDSEIYGDVIKGFLKSTPVMSESIREGPAAESVIYNKEGLKMKVMARFVNILEPTPEGIFYYSYIIICDKKPENSEPLALEYDDKESDDLVLKKKANSDSEKNSSINDKE